MVFTTFIAKLQLLAIFVPSIMAHYLEIPPVKLLTVGSVANRFPAAGAVTDGGFRTQIENGYDEDAHRTEIEELNDFPALRMVLNPGGCGFYQFEVKFDESNLFIQPAKKQGEYHEDYCDKAPVTLEVNKLDDSAMVEPFRCFETDGTTPDGKPIDPCSASACMGDISAIFSQDSKENVTLKVKICSDVDTSHSASIWELDFSRTNDSTKIEGSFQQPARKRISHIQDTPDFNTQLSIVSIVGKRGAGKSTVASLLSGNSSMFTTGSDSSGTTTVGADISTTFPSNLWATTLSGCIGITITPPVSNFPLFLIDSEGMGIRGDEFDFITTSPPAIIAKMILYMSEGSLTTDELLHSIDDYMNGLDNIIMDNDDTMKAGADEVCDTPVYGHFISVINKMMGDDPDEKLQAELMAPEPEYTDQAIERNNIRRKLETCFDDGVTVHGLPYLTVPPDTPIDYPILDQNSRYKDGLGKIAKSIVERIPNPRIVTVAGESRELNATNAESIIGTVITEANNGKIDLGGFDTFWEYTKSDIEIFLRSKGNALIPISPACNLISQATGYECTACVCSYRNKFVDEALAEVDQTLNIAKTQALSMFNVDLDKYIPEFLEEVVNPWDLENTCSSGSASISAQPTICDISTISLGQSSTLECNMLFMCKESTISGTGVSISADNIWIETGSSVSNAAISPGQNGANGDGFGASGGNGESGLAAPNLSISANYLLDGSDVNLQFMSKGGDGGNGGNGVEGVNNMGNYPVLPTNDHEVVSQGTQYDYLYRETGTHCGGHCHTQEEYWYYEMVFKTSAPCGGSGGNGGNGGNAGAAGQLTVSGTAGITATNTQLSSRGGTGGIKGIGVYGKSIDRRYTAWHHKWEEAGCHGFGGLECGPSYPEADGGYTPSGGDADCNGASGTDGVAGSDWNA